ncbi:MAG: hypothetical protein RR253_05030 [Oscillospiraceae bacterium]
MRYIFHSGGWSNFSFMGRFIIAMLILLFLHRQNQGDKNLARGIKAMVVLGVVCIVIRLLLMLLPFFLGGMISFFPFYGAFH